MLTKPDADIELSFDQAGRIVFVVSEPLGEHSAKFALLPDAAIKIGTALIQLARSRLGQEAKLIIPPSLN